MANTFVTADLIAERALPNLIEKIQMLGLVQNGAYDEAFTHKTGDTIQIRKPQRGEVVDGSGDISGTIQDIGDDSVDLTLSFQDTYPVSATSKEQSLNIDDFERQVVAPAMSKLAEKINERLLSLYTDIPYFSGVSGTTPASLATIASSRKKLQNSNAPKNDRSFVFDADAEAEFLQLDSLVEVDKSGSPQSLRDAVIGRVYDLQMVSDTMIEAHIAGGYTALADVVVTATEGATSMVMESTAGSSTAKLLKGDIFTLEDVQYTVTADTADAVSGDLTVSIYPAVPADVTAKTVVFADETAGAHVPNLMFQKDAFAIAFANLPLQPGAKSSVASANGFSIRVTSDYDFNNDKAMWRFDVLYGVVTTYPELAVRVLG